ncbi:MAG: hypothetical protein BMS9Abin13_213 [Patescibacteria group bacterium]|nr:MAG: hypothetical protein BMS9Abin13_213 [Patescibacteria group bacterium]
MGTRRNQEERKQLEIILSRAHEANALLVGEEGVGKMSVIYDFAWEIAKETAVPALRHKRVVYLDTGVLIAATKEKTGFEAELLEILQQAENAGNVILALGNLPSFIINAKSLGSDVMGLLGPYLESSSLQMIAISDTENFHRILGRDAGIMTHFEKIMMEEPDTEKIFVILEDVARDLERQSRIFFTYGAISEAVTSAENYFSDAVMPDKAIDLLMETVPLLAQKRKHLVRREDILELVESKTHIPVGKIKEAEKEKLMNLEELLHRRIIGQDEAVFAVSNAMRRSRTGIRDPQKPIGTFLFLGPTGVGKTETAKALASVFFGDDDAILRLDMSEYQTTDALSRLIGSFEEEKIGTLSTLLREKPYGVLLLDEFEKTNPEVLDLFLQILDEGFFSDMRGKRVNARNIIFIATSNAGSDIIWEAVKAGRKLSDLKDEIIEQIIKRGIFKPELLNRFDATVLFHPLRPEDLKKITVLMLGKLQKRLREKGVDLVVNDVLTNYVATQGYNPAFGARPMNRVIQERVEQLIADKLLSGELPRGSKVELTEAELSS